MAQMTIAATVISATQIDLRVTVGNWDGAQGYGVFYNTTGSGSKTLIYNSTTSGQVYSHKNLKLGTKYFYDVRSIVGYTADNKPIYGDVLDHTEATTLSYTRHQNQSLRLHFRVILAPVSLLELLIGALLAMET